ncbi:MAG TPA: DJ-1/PfpI family protein [Azospirillaceae bacterium]|nr:DJ-1/PfpI family protein [Azospirillaceae bacterium]
MADIPGQGGTDPDPATAAPLPSATSKLELAPPKAGRERPLIALLAADQGTAAAELMVAYSILKEAAAAEVLIVSPSGSWMALHPALRIWADQSLAQFDQANPEGADILIVPGLQRHKNPTLAGWVREQASKEAAVMALGSGAALVARSGLLDGRSAIAHWYYQAWLQRDFQRTRWIDDRSYVQDGRMISTAGIAAAVPALVALVEGTAGSAAAATVARRIGLEAWSPGYDRSGLSLLPEHLVTGALNGLAFWRHERVGMPVEDGFDEIAVAMTAEAWSRTGRSRLVAMNAVGRVRSRHGLILDVDTEAAPSHIVRPLAAGPGALGQALDEISRRYGTPTARLVALQLEHPSAAGGTGK